METFRGGGAERPRRRVFRARFGRALLTAALAFPAPRARAVLTVAGVWLSQHLLGRAFPPRIVVAPWLNGPERTEASSSQE